MSAKRVQARVGDLFLVPVSEDQRIYGQVIDKSGPQFLVVLFRSATESTEDAVRSGIELAGIVFDAKFRNGDWPIVVNRAPLQITPPWFVLGHEGLGNLRLENFDGTITRLASPAEAAKHRHRHISYPMALQMAAEATHGQREWNENLDCYRELGREVDPGPVNRA